MPHTSHSEKHILFMISVPSGILIASAKSRGYDSHVRCEPRRGHASLRVSLYCLQQEVLRRSESGGTREGQSEVPQVRQHQSRAAVGRLLRHHLEEKLTDRKSVV